MNILAVYSDSVSNPYSLNDTHVCESDNIESIIQDLSNKFEVSVDTILRNTKFYEAKPINISLGSY